MGHARALLGLADGVSQRRAAREVIARSLSVRETESLVKKLATPGGASPRTAQPVDVHTRAAEDQLKLALGTRVRIVRRGAGGTIQINFNSEDELHRLYEQLTTRLRLR
jgi:ParB family chromosome partitioning protein